MTGRASWQGLALLLLAPMAWAQTPQLTPADYARAESRLAHKATPLVDNALSGITWLEDGSVWFKRHDASGDHFERFQLPAGKTEPLFPRPVPKSPLFEMLSDVEREAVVREMEIESHDERIELNLYIVGELGEDEESA